MPAKRALINCALCLCALSSCQRSGKRQIGVIPKGTAHVFWQSVHAGALAAGKQFHAEILWNGAPNETDYSRELEIFDSMIARHVDGIAVAAADRDLLKHSLDRAAAEHIPVTVFDSGVSSTNYVTFVATDNFQAGQMAARALGGLLHGKGEVAAIMHAPGSASTSDRERGFVDVINREFPAIHIVAQQFSMANRAKAMTVTENILTANSNLDGIFASSEPSSVGAAQALKGRHMEGKVHFVAFDSSEGLIADLNSGVIDALVAQDPFHMGFEAVRTVAAKLNGETLPKHLDLPAHVITKADLVKPEVHALLYPDLTSLGR